MLERDDFAKRYAGRQADQRCMEFLYPLLQGYDSVAVEADVELGGTDQLFNLLVGRELQRERGQEPAGGADDAAPRGARRRPEDEPSRSGNYVGITEPPDEQFGKLMSIPDGSDLEVPPPVHAGGRRGGRRDRGRPGRRLAPPERRRSAGWRARSSICTTGRVRGTTPRRASTRCTSSTSSPTTCPSARSRPTRSVTGKVWLPKVLVGTGLAASNGEARRAVQQGGVRLDGVPLDDPEAEFEPEALRGKVLQVGRRRFVRLI